VGFAVKSLFEKTPAYPKGWLVLGNLGYASLWGVNVTVSESAGNVSLPIKPLGRRKAVGRYRRVNVSSSGLAGNLSLFALPWG
jgi:hypothetical protein